MTAPPPPQAGRARRLFFRIHFSLKYRTLKKIVVDPDSPDRLILCGHTSALRIPRYCPHQGADLSLSPVGDDYLICHWHGCQCRLSDGKFESNLKINMKGSEICVKSVSA